ncbi:hypothetical protein J40TS1_31030 [Paenibacillus montaniterrae]|uniref:Small multi-drug export protein n=1 Tax=Paenibacillus montaniterrae TaxID=429341 RepID=A0A919YSA2_9BACL|nr:small multi-drug export protein [Paenibacillus montaniterrae]GIP17461.1 hypothetical protein J40TS1_31030 [Paenibacillus montaniterrae]
MAEWLQELLIQIMEANLWIKLLSVFVVSAIPFFESYVTIPIGIVFGFPIVPVVIIGALGNWISVIVFVLAVSRLRRNKKPRDGKMRSNRWQRAQKLFQKYGVPGVSLLGPIICFHVAAAIALGAGTSKSYIMLWQTIAIAGWSIALGIAFGFGINLLEYIPNLNPFS